jgi:hypothetical protein
MQERIKLLLSDVPCSVHDGDLLDAVRDNRKMMR